MLVVIGYCVRSCSVTINQRSCSSLQGLFPPGQGATIGVDFMIKSVEIDNEKVKVSNSEVTFLEHALRVFCAKHGSYL